MGLLRVTFRLANPLDPSREDSVEVLVNTGALFSFISADLLTRLGIAPMEQATFQLADGRRIERPAGEARFFYDGKQGVSKVVFAQPGDATVMGVLALHSLGLESIRFAANCAPSPSLCTPACPEPPSSF